MKWSRLRASEAIDLNGFIGGPLPSRRVLDEFRPFLPRTDRGVSTVTVAFMDLDRVLATHALAILAADRAEAAFIAARASVDAADPGRARGHGVGSKRRAFVVRQARERRLAGRVREAADRLHHAPAEAWGDIALKLAAVIAGGEAGLPDATAFPWSALRHLLADVVGLTDASR